MGRASTRRSTSGAFDPHVATICTRQNSLLHHLSSTEQATLALTWFLTVVRPTARLTWSVPFEFKKKKKKKKGAETSKDQWIPHRLDMRVVLVILCINRIPHNTLYSFKNIIQREYNKNVVHWLYLVDVGTMPNHVKNLSLHSLPLSHSFIFYISQFSLDLGFPHGIRNPT